MAIIGFSLMAMVIFFLDLLIKDHIERSRKEGEEREGRGHQAVEGRSREICNKDDKAAKIYDRRDTGVYSQTFS